MKASQPNDYWCPMGRISLQRLEDKQHPPHIGVLPAGAYNLAVDANALGKKIEKEKERFFFASRCFGEQCPYYRRGFNPWGWGRCALAGIDYRPWIAAGIVLAFLGLLSLWWRS